MFKVLMSVLFVLMIMSVVLPYGMYRANGQTNGKQCLMMNAISFFALFAIAGVSMLVFASPAFAAEAGEAGEAAASGLMYVGAALATGLSGIGGGIAVASAASAAIGAMSENEKIMGKTLIFVALAEGIALYGLIISLLILFG